MRINKILSSFEVIFWDFDGTIKDTNDIKASAFESLFRSYGINVSKKVRNHHIENGGVSRYKKLSLYLKWVGVNDQRVIDEYAVRFSKKIVDKIIKSKWIKEVGRYIFKNNIKQKFVVVTATPQKEIEYIVKHIGMSNVFDSIYGYPMTKHSAIKDYIIKNNIKNNECIMIGDSEQDKTASELANINFCYVQSLYE